MPSSDQNVNQDRYKVVPRTLIFIFNNQGQVLLIRGSKNKNIWSGLLNGIGGHVEVSEDIYEAARREIEEETGLSIIPLVFCGQIMVKVEEGLGVALFLFRGTYKGDNYISSDEGKISWILIDDLENQPVVEDLLKLLPIVYEFKQGDPIIIGKYDYDDDGKLIISLQ